MALERFVTIDHDGISRCECGAAIECNECGDMPDVCPECGAELDYSRLEDD